MVDEKDFAKELNALIKRMSMWVATLGTLLTNCYERQIPCSGTTTSRPIWKPSLLPAVKHLRVPASLVTVGGAYWTTQ